MAFTNKSTFISLPENGSHEFFYPEDISILMSQENAGAIACLDTTINGESCKVLVAVDARIFPIPPDTKIPSSALLTDSHNLIALSCPPFDKRGGTFIDLSIPEETA